MAMVVKNNMSAVNTLNTLNKNQSALGKSLQKVSSGMKINSAQDDASGYAISERMRVMIRSLDQANQNTQNGSSLMKVAEGAVSNTVEILKTLKEKAINAATDTNTDEDRAIIQKEIDQLVDQIDDNALITFNGKYLLDGSKVQSGQATYATFTNQMLAEGTTGADALTSLKNRNSEDLGIISTDKITASYVRNGETFVTTFQVSDCTIQDIFAKLEGLEDEQQFADYTNKSVQGAVGLVNESPVSGSSNGYTYAQLTAAKEAADARVEELKEQLEAAQGTLGRISVDSKGWSTAVAAADATGTLEDAQKITDTSLINGAAGALAVALEKVSVLSVADGTNSKLFFKSDGTFVDSKTAADTTPNAFLLNTGTGATAALSNWDGNSFTWNDGSDNHDVSVAIQNTITALDARLATADSAWGAISKTNSTRADVQAARDELATAFDNYKLALEARDKLKDELTETETLQKALTDNVNAIKYKNDAEALESEVYTLIRDHLELAANPTVATATSVLAAGQAVGLKTLEEADDASKDMQNSIGAAFIPGNEDKTSAEFSQALDNLANTLTEQLSTFVEQNANSAGDAAVIVKAFLNNLGSKALAGAFTLGTTLPDDAWKVGSGNAGDLGALTSSTETSVLAAANWSASANNDGYTTEDLAEYGATYDKYLTAKTAAASETADLSKAMKKFGDNVSANGSIAIINSKNIGLNTANAVVTTADGTEGLTVTSNVAGLRGQISGITISVADAQGNVRKSVNTSLNAWGVTIFASNEAEKDNSLKFHIGAQANQSIAVDIKDMRAAALGLKGDDGKVVSVATQEKANAAIAVFENALQKALDQQTTIGAIEARLEYTSSNLTTSTENVQAAESTIRDADMAKEMTNYTKNNVLLQAAQSMLAQANQNSSAVLSLLQ